MKRKLPARMTVEELRALIDDVTLGTEIVFMISGTAAEFRPYEFWSETETPAVHIDLVEVPNE